MVTIVFKGNLTLSTGIENDSEVSFLDIYPREMFVYGQYQDTYVRIVHSSTVCNKKIIIRKWPKYCVIFT